MPASAKRCTSLADRQNLWPRPEPLISASSTWSRAVSCGNRLVIWNDRATPSLVILSGGRPVTL